MPDYESKLDRKVKEWRERYTATTANTSRRIRICYEISQEARELITPQDKFATRKLINELSRMFAEKPFEPGRKFIDTTRARRLVKLVTVNKSLITLASDCVDCGKKGASLGHLLLLTQISNAKDRDKTLKWSIKERAGYRKFRLEVEKVQATKARTRPKITINELESATEALLPLLKRVATKRYVSVVRRINSDRKKNSANQLKTIDELLTKIADLIPTVQHSIAEAKEILSATATSPK